MAVGESVQGFAFYFTKGHSGFYDCPGQDPFGFGSYFSRLEVIQPDHWIFLKRKPLSFVVLFD